MVKIILFLFAVGSTEPAATLEFTQPRTLETIQAFAGIGVQIEIKAECRPEGNA